MASLLAASLSHGLGYVYDAYTYRPYPQQPQVRHFRRFTIAQIRSIPQDAWNLWTIQFCPDLSQNRLLGHPITKSGSEEDPSDPMQHKIMGGGDAAVGEYPWTVWIGYYKKGRLLNACGGTLITRKHVATAAHCFWVNRRRRCGIKTMPSLANIRKHVVVKLGGVCLRTDPNYQCSDKEVAFTTRVVRIAMEDFFEQNCTGYKDIALLELRHTIPTELHHICLPHLHNIDHLDQKTASLRVAGWGLDPFHQTDGIGLVPRLQKLDVGGKMVGKQCDDLSRKIVPKGTFCTIDVRFKNVCEGDSGSGLITSVDGRYYLLGLLSHGRSCEDMVMDHRPGVQIHTDIEYFTSMIDSFIGMTVEDREEDWEEAHRKHTRR
ncbi:hypothetical protein Q1695_013891 [Nippostrongylus brasiliensis]|nr:hypothetical protein Q1695_013891 [Nippostrongylus brasiliensis]